MGTAHTLDKEMLLRYAARQLIDDAEPERMQINLFSLQRSKTSSTKTATLNLLFCSTCERWVGFFHSKSAATLSTRSRNAMQWRTHQAGPDSGAKRKVTRLLR